MQILKRSAGALLLIVIGSPSGYAQPASERHNVVRQIDHIVIATRDAPGVFSLFSDTLKLPVAWPITNYGAFVSGGISFGSVNLEVVKTTQPLAGAAPSAIVALALEPEPLTDSLPELTARGIRYDTPSPFRGKAPDGSTTTQWTTVGLPTVSSKTAGVFLCKYEHDVQLARRMSRAQLDARGGGPLAVVSVKGVEYGAADSEALGKRWQALLDPHEPSSPGAWPLGDGPAIRVVPAAEDGIRGIVVAVKSLERARQFLVEQHLLGAEQAGGLRLASPALEGVNVTLVQE